MMLGFGYTRCIAGKWQLQSYSPRNSSIRSKDVVQACIRGMLFSISIHYLLTSYRRQGVALCKSDFREKRPMIQIAGWEIGRRYFDSIYSGFYETTSGSLHICILSDAFTTLAHDSDSCIRYLKNVFEKVGGRYAFFS